MSVKSALQLPSNPSPSTASLLSLPVELRDLIYARVLHASPPHVVLDSHLYAGRHSRGPFPADNTAKLHVGLLQSCRTISAEFRPLLISSLRVSAYVEQVGWFTSSAPLTRSSPFFDHADRLTTAAESSYPVSFPPPSLLLHCVRTLSLHLPALRQRFLLRELQSSFPLLRDLELHTAQELRGRFVGRAGTHYMAERTEEQLVGSFEVRHEDWCACPRPGYERCEALRGLDQVRVWGVLHFVEFGHADWEGRCACVRYAIGRRFEDDENDGKYEGKQLGIRTVQRWEGMKYRPPSDTTMGWHPHS